jgi:glutamyl-tRNA(Gln) amidotransferase subunit D
MGEVDYATGEVSFRREYAERGGTELAVHPDLETEVELLKFAPGMDPAVLDVYEGKAGLVVEGTGLGHVNTELIPRLAELVEDGTTVVMTSQCLEGRVCDRVYDTGRDLLNAGVIEGEDTLPETAVVKLMWVLANLEGASVEDAMGRSLAGEVQARSTPWL